MTKNTTSSERPEKTIGDRRRTEPQAEPQVGRPSLLYVITEMNEQHGTRFAGSLRSFGCGGDRDESRTMRYGRVSRRSGKGRV